MTPGAIIALIGVALVVVGPPLALLLMSLTLLMLGVPCAEVRECAMKFVDRWIEQRGLGPLIEIAKAIIAVRGGESTPPS